MDNKKLAAVVGVLGGLAAILLLRKKAGAAVGASVRISVLDTLGMKFPITQQWNWKRAAHIRSV